MEFKTDVIARAIRDLQRADVSEEQFVDVFVELFSTQSLKRIADQIKYKADKKIIAEEFDQLFGDEKEKLIFGTNRKKRLALLNKNKSKENYLFKAVNLSIHGNYELPVFHETIYKKEHFTSKSSLIHLHRFYKRFCHKYKEILFEVDHDKLSNITVNGTELYGIRLETAKEREARITRKERARQRELEKYEKMKAKLGKLAEKLGVEEDQ